MAGHTVCVFLPVLLLGAFVVLAAANNPVLNMERNGEPQLEELLENDYLLLANSNSSFRSRKMLNRYRNLPVTFAPPVIRTSHTVDPDINLYLEGEDLLPTEIFGGDLLSRDRREAGSGDEDSEAIAEILVDEQYFLADADSSNRMTTMATDLRREVLRYGVAVDVVTCTEIQNIDGQTKYTFSVSFIGSTDRKYLAYALVRLWRDQREVGGYACISEPKIRNSVNILVNAICLLCPADRPCVNGSCMAFPTVPSTNGFESGLTEADIKLPKEDDVTSTRIEVPGDGFPFGGQYEKNIYVGDNGIVSFGTAFNPYNLRSMRSVDSRKFICVYCNDFDNRYAGGNVWYQAYPAGRPFATLQLDRASAEIRQYTQYRRFKANWVFVVTWSEIPEFSYYSEILTQGNTFQMVLITDGTLSFVRFYFDNIRGSTSFRGHGVHGYRWDTLNNVHEMLYSRRINGNVLYRKPFMHKVRGNMGQRGIWLFKIGEFRTPNYPGMCIQWYIDNLPLRSYFRSRARRLRNNRCPCRRRVLFWTAIFLPTPRFTSQAVYCSEMQAFFGRDTFECCYDIFGRFITRFPDAGGYSRYSRRLDPLRHQLQDSDPRDWCCRKSNLCHLYEDVRPRSSCFWNRPRRRRRFNGGDPHFTTLDGKTFTFNGIGEYRLIDLQAQALDEDFTFKLQCRTSQARTSSGEKVNASIYSSFAAAQVSEKLGSGKAQVELNSDRTKLVVYFDDVDTTAEFNNEANFTRRMAHLTAFKKSDTEIEFAFTQTDIVVGVTIISGTLAQSTVIPDTYKTNTTGLLGNFNDDTTDDFMAPDGTVYDADSTDKDLFPYGKTWAVPDQASSILHYAPKQNISTFVDNSFIPLFSENIAKADRDAGTQVCGLGNEPCIYDYALTKNENLAKNTTAQLEEAAADTAELENRAPLLSGTTKIDAEVGKSVNLTFIGKDDDSDAVNYVIVEGPSTGFTLNSTTGVAEFTPANTDPVTIRIAANDSKALSSVIDVKIRVCKCGSNGICDYSTPRMPITSENETLFQIASCICSTGYTGITCDDDKNGCADEPCGPDRACTDVTPDDEVKTNKAFMCDGCLPGYMLVDQSANSKCENIDECNATTGENNCSAHSMCIDTLGSYDCICDTGFRLNTEQICVDIDECLEHTYNCSQTCNNTEGSYKCECYGGYKLEDGTCVKDLETFPAACNSKTCPPKATCIANETRSAVCKCEDGYEMNSDESACKDINECTRHLCAQECENTEGSYICSCFKGFQLAQDKLDCTMCEFPNWGDNCQSTCECQGRAVECNPVQGCVCETGWTGDNCDMNINECTNDPGICGNNQNCLDNNGSYSCICEGGYEADGSICVDINECAANNDQLICPENSVCQNLEGSFVCNCNIGFKKEDGNCTDVDECATGQAMCQHSCRNKIGSYNCYCNPGFTLKDDRKECKLDPTSESECAGLTNLNCQHYCVLDNGVTTCQCNRGYYLAADNITCLDVNECESDSLNQCSLKTSCVNNPGSYTCSCPTGQKIKNDGRTCDDCDDNHWGPECANECSCTPLGTDTCDKIKGCVCKTGWAGNNCEADVDECGTASCQTNSDCVNLPGSYECKCRTGYRESTDSKSCDDINECNDATDNMCDHYCNDTVGSYFCTCRPGFIMENKGTCTDIDECTKGTHDCEQVCRNTVGSFTCECYDGFSLDPVGRKTCTVTPGATTCAANNCNTTVGGCRVDGGQDKCFCNPGYQLNGENCEDIDECNDPNICSDVCNNTPAGSFTCSCNRGFQLASDKTTCEACPPGKWGDCTKECVCDPSNSLACNATDGICTCRSGWTGTDCTTDIKECETDGLCGTNGVCNEKDGTYTCTCKVGFFRNNDICSPCSATTWGVSCANTCSCDFAKTNSCTSTDGACVCKDGWEGNTCTTDIDECSSNASPVCTGSNEQCRNIDGSFACDCVTGYEKSPNNSACVDSNECLLSTINTCTFQCTNTVGSFSCTCPPGYSGTGNNCTANFESSIILVVLDIDNSVIDEPNSLPYKKLQEDIGEGIDEVIKSKGGVSHLKTVIRDLRKGSVVAPAELRVDKSKTTNPSGVLAAELEKLANIRGISVDGNPTNMTNLTYKGIPIFEEHDLCDVLRIVRTFGDDELCEVGADGLPIAKKYQAPGLNIPLIIGLSVAIFILLLLLLLCIIYVCCCRRRKQSSERTPSEERDHGAFRSAFVGNLPTKGNFGASRYMMYSPHTLSDAGSQVSEDSSGRGRHGRKYGTNNFNDLPQWTVDDRSQAYSHPTRATAPGNQEPSSNFSWEHLFSRLEPLRDGQFEMPRPAVSSSPNKPFRDSLA